MIDHLTVDQERMLPVYREKWLRIGLSTEPADHARAEAAVADAYRVAGLKPPGRYIWLANPALGLRAAALILRGAQSGDIDTNEKVLASPAPHVPAQNWYESAPAGYGLHDAHWLAFYDFFATECDIKDAERLRPIMRLAEDAGWYWFFDDVVILTEKPSLLRRDDENRLHCPSGPALDYQGTLPVWCWHGVRVPERIIMEPDSYTAREMLDQPNVELRRIIMERMGWERIARELQSEVIDQDVDGAGQPRRLLRVPLLPDDPDGYMILCHVRCPSTGHEVVERVPPDITSCWAAVAWGYWLDVERYHPDIEV